MGNTSAERRRASIRRPGPAMPCEIDSFRRSHRENFESQLFEIRTSGQVGLLVSSARLPRVTECVFSFTSRERDTSIHSMRLNAIANVDLVVCLSRISPLRHFEC